PAGAIIFPPLHVSRLSLNNHPIGQTALPKGVDKIQPIPAAPETVRGSADRHGGLQWDGLPQFRLRLILLNAWIPAAAEAPAPRQFLRLPAGIFSTIRRYSNRQVQPVNSIGFPYVQYTPRGIFW